MVKNFLIFGIYFWHYFAGYALSQILGQHRSCRFYPSCSIYAAQALEKFGVVKGIKLAIWRILKCHPWGKFGVDEII